MCGIVGLIIKPDLSDEKLDNIRNRAGTLLRCAQVRGRDAAGIAVVSKGGVDVVKAEGPADSLVTRADYKDVVASIDKKTIAIIGHTRAWTQGSPHDNDNNHPLVDGHVTMVHNGWIRNWDELDAEYGALAEVDSASLAAVISCYADEDGLTSKNMLNACSEATGAIATVAVDERKPNKIYAYRNTNPLYGRTAPSGFWFGSTGEILRRAGVVGRWTIPVMPYTGCQLTHNGPIYGRGKAFKDFFAKSSKKEVAREIEHVEIPTVQAPKVKGLYRPPQATSVASVARHGGVGAGAAVKAVKKDSGKGSYNKKSKIKAPKQAKGAVTQSEWSEIKAEIERMKLHREANADIPQGGVPIES